MASARLTVERRKLLRELLRLANSGDTDAAQVLLDAIHDSHPEDAQRLALALQQRLALPAAEFFNTLRSVGRRILPPRRRPCMLNRRDLQALYGDYHDRSAITFAQLWRVLQNACSVDTSRAIESAMETANDAFGGHGVQLFRSEDATHATHAHGGEWGYYVNMGDTYNATLVWLSAGPRFVISSWGDVFEAWERAAERRRRRWG